MNENSMLSKIPETLKQLPRWILWRLENRDGNQTKVPYRIDGFRASTTNPNDWTDFATACRAFDPEKYNGLGFVLKKEDNIVCIDLDHCIGDDGKICDEAKNIVRILNSWTEISQSGKGLHIFVRGKKPTDKCKATPREFKSIEVYDHDRYIAMTGNHLPGTPLTIFERGLEGFCDLYFPKQESPPAQAIKPHHDLERSDEEIIALCRKARNADKFVALFDHGAASLYDGDESRADEALACMLAFYTKDAAQLERLMNVSALAQREKWRRREDYRRMTIQKALAFTREHYDAQPKSTMNLDSHPLTRLKGSQTGTSKPVIVFRDDLDEGKLFGKCPKCDLFTLDLLEQDGKLFLKCESCGFTCAAAEFELRHESTLRHEAAVSDNPMPNPLEKKYPLEKLNGTPHAIAHPELLSDDELFSDETFSSCLHEAKAQPPITPLFDVFWGKGELTFLFGSTGIGKSILAVQLLDAISKGAKIQSFDGPQEPMRVGLFDFELSARQHLRRYSDESGNIHDFSPNFFRFGIKAYAKIPKGMPRQDYILEQIEKKIIKRRIEVAVIDNLTALLKKITETEDALELMDKLGEIKLRNNISMLVIGHTPKRDLSKPLTENDMAGSMHLMNFCDSAFAIGKSVRESNVRYLKQIKTRNAEYKYDSENVATFRVVKNGCYLCFEHIGFDDEKEHLRGRTDAEMKELDKKIIALHQSEPNLSCGEIARRVGTNKMRVSRVLNKALNSKTAAS